MTRDELALLLENEAHNAAAERVRAGEDLNVVMRDVLVAGPRYDDAESRNAVAIFADAGKPLDPAREA